MTTINLCTCVWPSLAKSWRADGVDDAKDLEEVVGLLTEEGKGKGFAKEAASATAAEKAMLAKKVRKAEDGQIDIMKVCNRSLDIFKGILVIFMTFAHVDLTLMNPSLQVFGEVPHFVGNMASGLCFLGFMTAYGFSVDNAYLSDWKKRTFAQRFERVMRSAMLPVCAAWVCSMGWGYMCWKMPLDLNSLLQILDFRIALGNGPDFLLCFTSCLLAMYPLRHLVNMGLGHKDLSRRIMTAAIMMIGPLALTRCVVPDCTGWKKYFGYILECTLREPYAPVLPGLPHLFYFNFGVLLSRYCKHLASQIKSGEGVDWKKVSAAWLCLTAFFLVLCYPLASVWQFNYGNLMIMSRWGPITRGFVNGPSVLWLVGNLFTIDILLASVCAVHLVTSWHPLVLGPVRFVLDELEHLGANVLLYLVVGDLVLAGLWRGASGQYPMGTMGCFQITMIITLVTRFLHYLGASSRPVGDGEKLVTGG